ncbi:unnamed protein product [Acanthoscelides obtectus]|uniref:Uncharacterized protein n=1 Tax=Acanthoscelides obtectus TaxID=200917 RepID=A0A9P0JS63_ACAOB|nr:unnamed protein product [Acanthoscelides obtectus]CAK1663792.1 hypothetical protein AOBTE_LOCUS23857 [Acanthoscelides obtectus]
MSSAIQPPSMFFWHMSLYTLLSGTH